MSQVLDEKDRGWISALFGTAVGAGILYLPIRAAQLDFIVLIGILLVSVPCIWLAHRNLSEFCLHASKLPEDDVTATVVNQFGRCGGIFLIVSYFLSVFPISLLYGIGLTNIINDSLYKFFEIEPISRVWLSFFVLLFLNGILYKGEKWILKTCEILVIPLSVILIFCAAYLAFIWEIPVTESANFITVLKSSVMIIPLIVFSFNHAPACSALTQSYRLQYHSKSVCHPKIRRVLSCSILMLAAVILPFVISCVLSLTPQDVEYALKNNIPALIAVSGAGYVAWMPYVISVITLLAITSSYFGVYLGSAEGGVGIVRFLMKKDHESEKGMKHLRFWVHLGLFLSCWVTATMNFSVISIIINVVSPVLALLLFFVPIYAKYTDSKLKALRTIKTDLLIFIFGCFVMSGLVVSFFS